MQVFQISESCIYSIGSGQHIDCRQIELRSGHGGSLANGEDLTRGMCVRSCVARQMYSDDIHVA